MHSQTCRHVRNSMWNHCTTSGAQQEPQDSARNMCQGLAEAFNTEEGSVQDALYMSCHLVT